MLNCLLVFRYVGCDFYLHLRDLRHEWPGSKRCSPIDSDRVAHLFTTVDGNPFSADASDLLSNCFVHLTPDIVMPNSVSTPTPVMKYRLSALLDSLLIKLCKLRLRRLTKCKSPSLLTDPSEHYRLAEALTSEIL